MRTYLFLSENVLSLMFLFEKALKLHLCRQFKKQILARVFDSYVINTVSSVFFLPSKNCDVLKGKNVLKSIACSEFLIKWIIGSIPVNERSNWIVVITAFNVSVKTT